MISKQYILILLLFSWSCYSVTNSTKMENNYLPNQTILLYEQVFLDGGNHAGNFRFCFTALGGYFNNSNTEFESSDGSYWDTAFSDIPTIQLNVEDTKTLLEIITKTDWQQIVKNHTSTQMQGDYFERWTYVRPDKTQDVITIWNDERPIKLEKLKARLDELLIKY